MRDPDASIRFEAAQVVRSLVAPLVNGHFLRSDLARRWVADRRLVDFAMPDPLSITSPRVPFVTHPFEWCDAQLFSAAQLSLGLQREAVDTGYDLKDASAWNVIFDGTRPIFCDLLSFLPLKDRRWWAMGQYARHFLLPLLVSRRRGLYGHQSFSVWRDGLPPTVARRLLGPTVFMTRYGPLLFGQSNPVRAHSAVQRPPEASGGSAASFRSGLHTALDWMLAGVTPPASSRRSVPGWSGYEDDRPHYTGESLSKKRATIGEWLTRIRPKWVADFGCNTGEFSKLAAEQGAHVVALDADHESIQQLYRTSAPHWHLYPVVVPLDDIGSGRGWAGTEHPGLAQRLHDRFDVVMMLALIHHLAVGASIPLSAVAEFARACTRDWTIVEFVDEADPQLTSLCAQRQRTGGEFSAARQRAAFVDAGFHVEAEVDLFPAKRTLVLLRKNS